LKTKIALIIYTVIGILGLMLLLSRENLYVALALVLGFLLLGYREIWSLIRYRRLPVIDERVRDNLTGAMRLTGVFFFIASIVLILLLHFDIFKGVPTSLIISGMLVVMGIMYVIGYNYYDRVKPNMGEKSLRFLKICLVTAGLSIGTIALAIALHNMMFAWFGIEDAVFFIIGLLGAPAILAISLLGSLAAYAGGLLASFSGSCRE